MISIFSSPNCYGTAHGGLQRMQTIRPENELLLLKMHFVHIWASEAALRITGFHNLILWSQAEASPRAEFGFADVAALLCEQFRVLLFILGFDFVRGSSRMIQRMAAYLLSAACCSVEVCFQCLWRNKFISPYGQSSVKAVMVPNGDLLRVLCAFLLRTLQTPATRSLFTHPEQA